MLFSLSKPGVPWRTGLRSAAVVSLLAMGATACGAGGSSDNPQAGQAPQSTQATSTPDGKKTLDAPVAKGLGSLTSGNLTLLAFYDPSTGKETFSTTLPQYSEKNPWKRYSFSPDWKRHAWVKDGDLFVGSFTGSTITSAYDETPGVKIGGKPPSTAVSAPTASPASVLTARGSSPWPMTRRCTRPIPRHPTSSPRKRPWTREVSSAAEANSCGTSQPTARSSSGPPLCTLSEAGRRPAQTEPRR